MKYFALLFFIFITTTIQAFDIDENIYNSFSGLWMTSTNQNPITYDVIITRISEISRKSSIEEKVKENIYWLKENEIHSHKNEIYSWKDSFSVRNRFGLTMS